MMKSEKDSRDKAAIQAENDYLRQELEYMRLRAVAFETMIDVAERELQIDIRKKSGTKQSGK